VARRKLDRPTRAMKDAALRTLHGVVTNPRSPTYAKVNAAKALIQGDRDEGDELQEDRGPPPVLILPDNGRDPALTRLGITRSEGVITIIYDGKSEAGVADLARWRAEVDAEIQAAHPALLLPPDRPKPLTPAERQRRRRERLRTEKVELPHAAPSFDSTRAT
jgi:hypothetical protein